MKKIVIIMLLLCVLCSCANTVLPDETTTAENISSHSETASTNEEEIVCTDDDIIVVIRYDDINTDFSVYNTAYFGEEFSECTIYDIFGGHGLYIGLKLKTSSDGNIDNAIEKLNDLDDVMYAQKNDVSAYRLSGELTEYMPGKAVYLLNRKYPFTKEYAGFEYVRNYRLIYYDVTNFNDLVTEEQYNEWVEYYKKNNNWTEYDYLQSEPEEMALVSFIKHFNIPKETMQLKIKELESQNKDRVNTFGFLTENSELPNLDIIYTFDNDVINDYYRYE